MTILTGAPTAVEYTPEDLLRLPDGDSFELVDGRLVEKHMGGESSFVGGEILTLLNRFIKQGLGGWVFGSDAGYRCFTHRPRLVRKPDVSWIRRGRLPNERLPRGDILIPPDLAVEVVSPNDLYSEIDAKVSEYLQVGIPMIWVVNPETRTAMIYHPGGSFRRLREEDEIDGGDVLPGFRCLASDLFPPSTPDVETP